MKKSIKVGIAFLLVLCIAGGIFVAVKLTKKWPEGVVYTDSSRFFTEDGMYYFENSTLKFYDKTTGMNVVVCSKPNCEHKDGACYAHFDALSGDGSMMVYDNKIYIYTYDQETVFDENEDIYIESAARVEQLDMDGNNRKVIYSADSGSVTGMLAVDGKLYYTAYRYQNGFEMNTYLNDCTLYCYDINWGTNKEICTFIGSENRYAATLDLLASPDSASCLYMVYTYYDRGSFENPDSLESICTSRLIRYQDGETEESDFPANMSIHMITEQGAYCTVNDEADIREFALINENGEMRKLAEYSPSYVYAYPGYIYFIYTDEEKMLYDYEKDIWYIANTAIREEEKWISSIYYIDAERDTVYYDAHDYTGITPGTLLPAGMNSNANESWKKFLEDNFTEYDGRELEWFSVTGEGEE